MMRATGRQFKMEHSGNFSRTRPTEGTDNKHTGRVAAFLQKHVVGSKFVLSDILLGNICRVSFFVIADLAVPSEQEPLCNIRTQGL
eukprot:4881391-Amphidinium_carterae.1